MKNFVAILTLVPAVFAAAALAPAPAPFARSLVSRMLEARDGSSAPAKRMWYSPDFSVKDAEWDFNVQRVEALLEKSLVKADDGSYRMKRDADAADSRKASADALAYVNRFIAEWAVMQLDTKFSRCEADTVKALAGYRVDLDPQFWSKYAIFTKKGVVGGGAMKSGGWISAWQITPGLYLLLTNELGRETHPRDYQLVMWDGKKDWPIAGFDSFPDANRVALAKRVLTVPAAVNNLAVAIHSHEINRNCYMRDYVESLLRRAARDGCETAFHNLGVLMEEKGLKEEAEAFYSRERNASAVEVKKAPEAR